MFSGLPDLDQNMFKEIVSIYNFNERPIPVKEVFFKLNDDVSKIEAFIDILKSKYKHRIYNINSTISVTFYGQVINIELVKFIPVSDDVNLVDLSLLTLDDTFYLIQDSTKWTLNRNQYETAQSEKTINLNRIGGYKQIISDLKKEINFTLKSSYKSSKPAYIKSSVHGFVVYFRIILLPY